ncbi:MAG: DUF6134 family protein [Rhodospirillales bacterium]
MNSHPSRRPTASAEPGLSPGPFSAAFPPVQRLDRRLTIHWKNMRIGSYHVSIRPADGGDATLVLVEIKMKVAIGPITMFRFRHRGEEEWRSGDLWRLETHTEEHGEAYEVHGRQTPEGTEINGSLGPCLAPPGLLSSTGLWCRAITRQTRIIDAQNGAVVGFTATATGSAEAGHFQFEGASWRGEIWYDDEGLWSRAILHREGHTLTLQLDA